MTVGQVSTVLTRAAANRKVAAALPVHQRMAVLNQVADWVQERAEDFARLIATEGIKTIREARKEVGRCVDTLRLVPRGATCAG